MRDPHGGDVARAAVGLTVALVALALSGCVSHSSTSPVETRTGRQAGRAQDITPLVGATAVAVSNVTPTSFQVTYAVRGENATSHVRVETPDDEPDIFRPSERENPRRVTVTDRTPDRTYRFQVVVTGPDAESNRTGWTTVRTAPPPGWAPPGEAWIRPGVAVGFNSSASGGCTLGFILAGPYNVTAYALTAGHCVEAGTPVYLQRTFRYVGENHDPPTESPFGIVRESRNNRTNAGQDWALIEVFPEYRPRVSPAVEYWSGPTGVAQREDVAPGDDVCVYGDGSLGLTFPNATKDRCGAFVTEATDDGDAYAWWAAMIDGPGDSGAPVLHHGTGAALGILTQGLVTAYDLAIGPTVDSILDQVADRGYDVRLASAAYDPPPPAPV